MSVNLAKSGQLSYIEFSSEKANSFSLDMLNKLSEMIVGAGSESKVIVIKSLGEKTFSAGASFNEFNNISSKEQALEYFSGFMKVLESIRLSSCPIICRVQGRAVGGAVGLIAACDYVFAHSEAQVKLSELDLGIGPFTISVALERKIGISRFSEMLLDTEWKESSWSMQSGLFTKIYSDIDSLDSSLGAFAGRLCKQEKKTLEENRKVLWSGTENWPDLMLERANTVSELLMLSK